MLRDAGVAHEVVVANVDEAEAKASSSGDVALDLAKAKALAVSERRPGVWVIGGDSVVTANGRRFDKPIDRDQAAEHLRFFSGKAMTLTSAVAVAKDGGVDWAVADDATLQWRELSEEFIEQYLAREWPEVSYCVGVFRLEGPGVQLFDRIEGSHFTILGMPLLPLLGALRAREVLPA
ncbi:MAG: Maf family protein [Pseudomonadota bacterium]|nr:Maf family protein [Pseudomonadota bacterium]